MQITYLVQYSGWGRMAKLISSQKSSGSAFSVVVVISSVVVGSGVVLVVVVRVIIVTGGVGLLNIVVWASRGGSEITGCIVGDPIAPEIIRIKIILFFMFSV